MRAASGVTPPSSRLMAYYAACYRTRTGKRLAQQYHQQKQRANTYRRVTRWSWTANGWRTSIGWQVRKRLCQYCGLVRVSSVRLVRRFWRPSDGKTHSVPLVNVEEQGDLMVQLRYGEPPVQKVGCRCEHARWGPR